MKHRLKQYLKLPRLLILLVLGFGAFATNAGAQGGLLNRSDLHSKFDPNSFLPFGEGRLEDLQTLTPIQALFESGLHYDTNAFMDSSELEDWWLESKLTVTTDMPVPFVDKGLELSPYGNIGWNAFNDFSQLSSNSLGAGVDLKGIEMFMPMLLNYESNWIFSEGFGDDVLTTHVIKAETGIVRPLGDSGANGGLILGVSRQFSDPSELDGFEGYVKGMIDFPLADGLKAMIGSEILYRGYDSFGPEDRHFWQPSAMGSVVWSPIPGVLDVSGAVEYQHHSDTFDAVGDFNRLLVTLGVQMTY